MSGNRYTEAAESILARWQGALSELKPRYEEAVFAAMVAFLGMQNGIWPLWLKLWQEAGGEADDKERTLRLLDPELHQLPWFCLFNPINTEGGWLLVRGSGLPDSAEVLPELLKNEVCYTMMTLDGKGEKIIYGNTGAIFDRWGLYEDRVKLPNVALVRGMDEVMSGGESRIRVATVHCDKLLKDLPVWHKSVISLRDELQRVIAKLLLPEHSAQLEFMYFAEALWQQMREQRIIHCEPFGSGRVPFLESFRARRTLVFHGFIVVFGDHQQLWQEIKRQY